LLRQSRQIGWWAVAAFSLVQACSREAPPKQFAARVDQALLTEDEIATAHDSLAYTPQRRREYINDWVNAELLYQEAMRRGLGDDKRVRQQVEDAAKKLIVGALLERELYADENVSDDEIVALHNGGGDAFRLREDVVNVSYALFSDRDAANTCRTRLVSGTLWSLVMAEASRDSLLKSHLVRVATRQFFTQSNLYPAELWKLARTLGKDEVSFVLKTDAGYYLLVSHGVKKQGEIPELDYIRSEIRDRILIERRRTRYDRLLADLRAKHSVEVRLAESDTTSRVQE